MLAKVVEEWQESDTTWQVACAHATKHPQVRLQQRQQTLSAMLVHVTTRLFLLRAIDVRMHVALHRPRAAGRVGGEPTPSAHRDVSRLLYCLQGQIFGHLYDDSPLTTDPRDDCRPGFVIVAPPGRAFLAATSRSAAQ